MNEVQVEPRNVAWATLIDGNLSRLIIRDAVGYSYCDLFNPSPSLASAALWEAVLAYARKNIGNFNAPPLQIYASPAP